MTASKFFNLSIDTSLGGNSPSDYLVPSEKAIKTYVDNNSGGGGGESANKNINNLTTLGNARLQYAPFAINAGTVANGKNNTLTYSGTVITCSACTITTCDGKTLVDINAVTLDISAQANGTYYIFKSQTDGALSVSDNLTISTKITSASDGDYWLDISTTPANLKIYDTSEWVTNNNLVYIGKCTLSSGSITEIENRVFNNNDYSEGSSTGAGFAMPSNAYNELTVGATGTSYTAPANGWFTAYGFANDSSQVIALSNSTNHLFSASYANASQNRGVYLPALKGDEVKLFYAGGITAFYFVYANGSKGEK